MLLLQLVSSESYLSFTCACVAVWPGCAQVCQEEKMREILERYVYINRHAATYTWKYNGEVLNMERTLEENGVLNKDEEFYEVGIDEEQYRPGILLHFNDNLTEI